MYTNSWDPNNGQILISANYGRTFSVSKLHFTYKAGGTMPGRGTGEVRNTHARASNVWIEKFLVTPCG